MQIEISIKTALSEVNNLEFYHNEKKLTVEQAVRVLNLAKKKNYTKCSQIKVRDVEVIVKKYTGNPSFF